jgi:hypothetical protein
MIRSLLSIIIIGLAVTSCGSQSQSPVDSGRDEDSGSPKDAGAEAGTSPDAGRFDAGDPQVYPCEATGDCIRWWYGAAATCEEGFCCEGRFEDRGCICGDRTGGCPPMTRCCVPTARRPEECSPVCDKDPP